MCQLPCLVAQCNVKYLSKVVGQRAAQNSPWKLSHIVKKESTKISHWAPNLCIYYMAWNLQFLLSFMILLPGGRLYPKSLQIVFFFGKVCLEILLMGNQEGISWKTFGIFKTWSEKKCPSSNRKFLIIDRQLNASFIVVI